MRKTNVLEVPQFDEEFRPKVISARKAADRMGLAHNTFFKGLAGGYFIAQATIEGEGKNAYGFEPEYIEEVRRVLPRRAIGQSIFTPDIVSELEKINVKWRRKR